MKEKMILRLSYGLGYTCECASPQTNNLLRSLNLVTLILNN